jgi:integrase/recombinase XerD
VYWRAARPKEHLFPGWREGHPMSSTAISMACRNAAKNSGIAKRITAHTLRHYAASRTMPRVGARAPIHGRLNRGNAV